MIQFEPRSITQAINRIRNTNDNISGDILNQAISRALNRTASQSRTKANSQIRQVYNISASRINNELKVRNSSRRDLTASITASGSPLSLNHFGAKQVGNTGTTSFNRKGVASSRLNRKSRSNVVQLENIAYSKLSAVTPTIENAAKKTLNAIDYGVERGIKLIKKRK